MPKEDSIELRIMKSNLSDKDKIEIIKRLNQQIVYYPYPEYPAIYGVWEFTC